MTSIYLKSKYFSHTFEVSLNMSICIVYYFYYQTCTLTKPIVILHTYTCSLKTQHCHIHVYSIWKICYTHTYSMYITIDSNIYFGTHFEEPYFSILGDLQHFLLMYTLLSLYIYWTTQNKNLISLREYCVSLHFFLEHIVTQLIFMATEFRVLVPTTYLRWFNFVI